MFGKSRPSFDATQARVQQLRSVLPTGADVDVMEPDGDGRLTYLIEVVADRAQTSALLASAVEIVSASEERWSLELSVSDSADDASAYSTIDLPDEALPTLDVLRTAHDELYPFALGRTITLDASDGAFTVGDVPRDRAVATARAAARWWEGLVAQDISRWAGSSLSVDIGTGEDAEITYSSTIERDRGAAQVSEAEWAQRVLAAWNDNLPALGAMVQLPVPAGHSVDVTFTASTLEPRLSVTHLETYDEDEDAASDLVAQIRAKVPGSTLAVG